METQRFTIEWNDDHADPQEAHLPIPSVCLLHDCHRWHRYVDVSYSPLSALQGGRLRWKIENEGFNFQKNGGFELEHAYSTHVNAYKIFYFLMQIAHIIFQLLEKGSLLRNLFSNGIGSAKNLSFRLLEAWRNASLPSPDFFRILPTRLQIRFDSS